MCGAATLRQPSGKLNSICHYRGLSGRRHAPPRAYEQSKTRRTSPEEGLLDRQRWVRIPPDLFEVMRRDRRVQDVWGGVGGLRCRVRVGYIGGSCSGAAAHGVGGTSDDWLEL